MSKKIVIFDDDAPDVTRITDTSNDAVLVTDNVEKVITVYEPGPPGPSGASPFRLINGVYRTNDVVSFGNFISSSLVPTGSFNVGSESNPFNYGYLDNIRGVTLLVRSSSISMSFTDNGIFTIPEFNNGMPQTVVVGGLIKSGSNLYIGI